MRIVSKFKDYYDSIAYSMGYDESFTFVREKKEYFFNNKKISKNNKIRYIKRFTEFKYDNKKDERGEVRYDCGWIGFCGEIYPFILETLYVRNKLSERKTFFYDAKNFNENSIIARNRDLFKNKKCYNYSFKYNLDSINVKSSDDIIDFFKSPKSIDFLFKEYNCAYFCLERFEYNESDLIIYPILQDYQFFKVKDIYQASQEIELFLNNTLSPKDEINIDIPDELKAHSHGFNKYSFRKDKREKK